MAAKKGGNNTATHDSKGKKERIVPNGPAKPKKKGPRKQPKLEDGVGLSDMDSKSLEKVTEKALEEEMDSNPEIASFRARGLKLHTSSGDANDSESVMSFVGLDKEKKPIETLHVHGDGSRTVRKKNGKWEKAE